MLSLKMQKNNRPEITNLVSMAEVEPARQIIPRYFKSLVSANFTSRAIASDVKDPLKVIGPNAKKV